MPKGREVPAWGNKYMKRRKIGTMCAAVALASSMGPAPAHAQSDPILGQLMLIGFNFCPRGWMSAEGQLLAISSNTALFSLYGTTYGGDGRTTFMLPDLRGRVPIGYGQGPGLSNYAWGQKAGLEYVTLITPEIPSHSHTGHVVAISGAVANKASPNGNVLARSSVNDIYIQGAPTDPMANGTVQTDATGGSQSHENRMPYLAMKWCVATQGIYPSRN